MANASNALRVGDRDEQVFVVAAPSGAVEWGVEGYQIGDADMWVQSGKRWTPPSRLASRVRPHPAGLRDVSGDAINGRGLGDVLRRSPTRNRTESGLTNSGNNSRWVDGRSTAT